MDWTGRFGPASWTGAFGPVVLGVVNVTPDSFSDGGRWLAPDAAVAHGLALLDDGADWLDVGGESTRPGAPPVDTDEELRRVLPVIEGLVRARPDVVVSVDTRRAVVAEAALTAGARVVNDVTGLSDAAMRAACARAGCAVILMHMRGTPETMQSMTTYEDLVGEVGASLDASARAAMDAGIARERIAVDPGVGFAKTSEANPVLIAGIPRILEYGWPVVVGASRKRFVGDLTGVPVAADRVHGSVGAALAAFANGASVLRVHDVRATREALQVYRACRGDRR